MADARQEQEEFFRQMRLQECFQRSYGWLGGNWTNSGLQKKLFRDFQGEEQKEALEAVKAFAQTLKGTLVLYGPFGVGKTHLLAALCNYLNTHGENNTPRFVTSPNLFASISHHMSKNWDYADLIYNAATCSLLILDDVDKAKWSEFREETYFAIIDQRVNQGLPTALSTNRLTELETFVGGAVASRLSIGQIAIEMTGQDYRPQL